MVVFEPLFCDQSMKTLLARNTFAIRDTTRSGMSCSIASAISLANSRGVVGRHRPVEPL